MFKASKHALHTDLTVRWLGKLTSGRNEGIVSMAHGLAKSLYEDLGRILGSAGH